MVLLSIYPRFLVYVLGIEMNIRHIISQGVHGSVVGRSGVRKRRGHIFGRHIDLVQASIKAWKIMLSCMPLMTQVNAQSAWHEGT